jgi:hypothetical protein
LYHVVDVAERSRLTAIPVQRNGLAFQRLHDKIRHYSPVVHMHAGTVGVEDARNLDAQSVLLVVTKE